MGSTAKAGKVKGKEKTSAKESRKLRVFLSLF